ncbi:hypothetical protein HanLR1_Chr13g0480121 [Helianthus annuus]|nr:hypothetical protein HanLR1_Chr13g0480121 [Helianthus annuus]
MSNIGSEVRREVNTGIGNISRMIERLDVRENNRKNDNHQVSDARESNHNRVETAGLSGTS